MKISRLVIALVIIIGVFTLLIFFRFHILSPKVPPSPLEKITIGRVEGYPDLALIAQNQHYFRENGLEVTFREYDRPAPLMRDLLLSKINLVSATAEFLVVDNSFNREPLKIIAVVSTQDNQWEVIARKDKNVQNITDLKGKKIGVQLTTAGGFLLGRFLSYYGLTANDVEIDDLSRPEYTDRLLQGDIDAVVVTSPYTQQIKTMLGSNAISWSAQPQRTVYSVTYTTSDFTKKHPDIIDKYLQALLKAEQFVKSSNDQAKSIMRQELHVSNSDINDLWTKFNFGIGLPQELFPTMEDEARWIIENRLTNATKIPNYLDFVDFHGLEAVKPESITAFH